MVGVSHSSNALAMPESRSGLDKSLEERECNEESCRPAVKSASGRVKSDFVSTQPIRARTLQRIEFVCPMSWAIRLASDRVTRRRREEREPRTENYQSYIQGYMDGFTAHRIGGDSLQRTSSSRVDDAPIDARAAVSGANRFFDDGAARELGHG